MNKKMNNNKIHWLIFIVFSTGSLATTLGFYFTLNASEETLNKSPIINEYNKNKNIMTQIAVMKTNYGDIKLELFAKDAPVTVANFLKLSKENFYNSTKFHRVIKGFMIQGGDPNSKDDDWSNDGTGGPGYSFKDEINSNKIVRGTLAMANAGPNTNGSQFFIVTAQSAPWLDGKHTAFGKVVEGMDVVDKIENAKTNNQDHPMEDIVVKSIKISE